MFLYITGILVLILVRLFIFRTAKKTAVDQYFWLLYRKYAKEQRKIPPEIPNYILDVKQWYPPMFGYLLYILPEKFIRNSFYVMSLLSLARISIFLFFAVYLDKIFTPQFFFSLALYIISPILVYYDNQITSRILGAIILDVLIICIWLFLITNNLYILVLILFLNLLLIYTHKMSHQLYVFILLVISLFIKNIILIVLYLFSIFTAIKFLGYKKYLQAHIEIVRFWDKNKYLLGAHQFYESPIYRKKDYISKNRLHGKDIKFILKKLSLIIGFFPFIVFLIFNLKINYFSIVVIATILFILLTSFSPKMYCLGAGYLYTYNLVSFTAFYIVFSDIDLFSTKNIILIAISTILTFISIIKFYLGLLKKNNLKDIELEEALNFLKNSDIDRIIVIPFQLPDEVTYKTGKKVFWGAHGLGFKLLDNYFPIFKVKIENAVKEWNLGGIILQKDYWPEFEKKVDMQILKKVFENNKYAVYAVIGWKNNDKTPNWAKSLYKGYI